MYKEITRSDAVTAFCKRDYSINHQAEPAKQKSRVEQGRETSFNTKQEAQKPSRNNCKIPSHASQKGKQ